MRKLSGPLSTIAFMLILVSLTESSCQFFQPTAQFFIINESQDKKAVDFKVTIGKQKIFDDTLRFNNVRPDLRYTPSTTLTKGKYVITVTGDNGKIQVQQPIMLDGNRFIFVIYEYKMPVDSMTLVKKLGYAPSDRLRGQEPKVGILITDKEPVQL